MAGPAGDGRDIDRHDVSARQLAWLEQELARWQAQGHLGADAAAAIRGQYRPTRRLSLARLLLALGAAFVGVGLIWLVAANLDQLSPGIRFAGITALWLAAVVAGELLADRRHREGSPDAVVGAVRLVAALAFGGVVFQAAQSLQVPAYDPGLVGAWAAGALLYAYAAAAVAPLLVGVAAGTGWYVWVVVERTDSPAAVVLALLLAAVLAGAVAVGHSGHRRPEFAPPWRVVSALLALVGLFVAALPQLDEQPGALGDVGWTGAVLVLLVAAYAAARADRTGRLELLGVGSAALVAALLLRWRPPQVDRVEELSGEALARAVAAILVYLLAAAWFAALGVLRETSGLTQLATAALVLFTVVQSFAVFEPILSGAALFLALGVVLAVSGYLVDRGRRRLVADVREATT